MARESNPSSSPDRPGKRGREARSLAAVIYGVLLLWGAGLTVGGILTLNEVYGPYVLGLGIGSLLCAGVGLWLGSWAVGLYAVLTLTSGAMLGAGIALTEMGVAALGAMSLIIVGVTIPIAWKLTQIARRAPTEAAPGGMSSAAEHLLREIHEHTILSDSAKRLLFRERELDLLRQAIEDDIRESKYNVALKLCDEMSEVFGYREEAEMFRQRILQARQERFEHEVRTALAHFDELLAGRNWAAVHQEAARIRRLFGDSHLVQNLDDRIMNARQAHRAELEQRFLQAAQHEDVERAMDLLKQLDRYLDRSEAERLAEVAQGVVVRHRDNLGVQFKLAVNDRRWAEAARVGETIIEEFPNTKMADEVRSMIDLLRTRASQAAVAGSH